MVPRESGESEARAYRRQIVLAEGSGQLWLLLRAERGKTGTPGTIWTLIS